MLKTYYLLNTKHKGGLILYKEKINKAPFTFRTNNYKKNMMSIAV